MDYEQIMERDYISTHQQDARPRCCDWDASRLGVRSWRAMLSCGPDHQLNYSIPLQVWKPRNWVLACIYVPPFRPDYSHICIAISLGGSHISIDNNNEFGPIKLHCKHCFFSFFLFCPQETILYMILARLLYTTMISMAQLSKIVPRWLWYNL
jgi:hypothetical protein